MFNYTLLQNEGLQPLLHFKNNILNCPGSSQLIYLILAKGLCCTYVKTPYPNK